MLEAAQVTFAYDGGPPALDGVTMQFPEGSISALMGESGSGKTTLLMCLARFLKPRTGTIRLDGEDIDEIAEPELRRRLGVVFQDLDLFPHLNVSRNLALAPEKVMGMDRGDARQRADEMLKRLGIPEIGDRYPSRISGGQAQRVAIARALMLQPEYLLLDEPTAALDINTTAEFATWLTSLREMTTFVVVTHDVPFASSVASSGALLEGGAVRRQGPLQEIVKELEHGAQRVEEGR
jgi:ABC-type polar amino acid transport system ATPase subunit